MAKLPSSDSDSKPTIQLRPLDPEGFPIDAAGNIIDDTSVFVVKQGLIGFGWCCAPKSLSMEEVQTALNSTGAEYVKGTPWTVTSRINDDPTLVSPGRCDECANRQHWYMIGGLTGIMLIALLGEDDEYPQDLKIQGAD